MFKRFKWAILLSILFNLVACADGNPQVDFLRSPSTQKVSSPGKPSSVNLSPTTVAVGGAYKAKGRVSSIATHTTAIGGNYKIKGKISF